MLDSRMQQAYLAAFQYDDIDSAVLPGEADCTPRVGDEGALFLDYPDGSGDAEELMFRVGVMDSGLPVIELRASADDDWGDEVGPCFFDEISLRNGMVLILQSRTPAAHSPGYPYGMTEDDPKLFDLDTEDEQHGTRAAQWDTATRRMVMGHIRNELDTQQAMVDDRQRMGVTDNAMQVGAITALERLNAWCAQQYDTTNPYMDSPATRKETTRP